MSVLLLLWIKSCQNSTINTNVTWNIKTQKGLRWTCRFHCLSLMRSGIFSRHRCNRVRTFNSLTSTTKSTIFCKSFRHARLSARSLIQTTRKIFQVLFPRVITLRHSRKSQSAKAVLRSRKI